VREVPFGVRDIKVEKKPTRVCPSRDRGVRSTSASAPQGADIQGTLKLGTLKLFCNEQGHGFALLFDNVLDSLPYILILP